MNHFNYFSEIESAFVRRRGKNLLLSPVDWALIESWEKEGIPLKIVLSTIDELFDQIEADPKRAGSIRTLSYCRDAVEARYRTWKESMVGAPESDRAFAEDREHGAAEGDRLRELSEALGMLVPGLDGKLAAVVTEAKQAIDKLRDRSANIGEAETELDRLDASIDDSLLEEAEEREVKRMREAAVWELGDRASLMDKESLERTTELVVKKELRQRSGIPPLGMFRL